MNRRAFIYGFTWTQRFRISIWDLLEQFNKVWFLTVNCWKINYLNDKTKIAYLFVLICSCTEIHYKILRASASMKRENNCMCKRHPVTRKPDSAWSYIWYGLKFILTIYIIYMLRRRNLTSSYLRNRGASRHRMRSPNFQSAKPFLTLLNNVKVLQAKLIFEEKINLSYIHIKIKVWRYPYLSQFFRK